MDAQEALKEIALANKICVKAHEGQTRKNSDEPYSNHPLRVACLVSADEFNLPAVALLHDVLEDTDYTEQTLAQAGISREVIVVVRMLTRRTKETYYDYILRISFNEAAVAVKLADLADNLRDLDEGSMKDKYRLARYVLRDMQSK